MKLEKLHIPAGRTQALLSALLTLPAALLLVFTTATTAQAHYVYQDDEIWSNNDSSRCLYTYAEVSHGSGGGYVKAYSRTNMDDPIITHACILPWNRPPVHIGVGYEYLKHSGDTWYICKELMHGVFNHVEATRVEVNHDFGVAPPCGEGYYGTHSYSQVKYHGAGAPAQPTGLFSGSHYIEP